MFRNNRYPRGMFTVFFSVGSKPLSLWDMHIEYGYITRMLDQDIKSMVLEIGGDNVSTTYITCPKGKNVLGISLPFLVMIVKNLKKYFTFEVTILDESGFRRRFRVSNFQSNTQICTLFTVMPIGLSEGWNQIQFNLAEFTQRAYKKQFVEVQRVKVNANIRLRRIYFTERLLPDDELPAEYKLFFPISSRNNKKLLKSSHSIEQIETGKRSSNVSEIKKHLSQQLNEHSKSHFITRKDTVETVKLTDNEKNTEHETLNNGQKEIQNDAINATEIRSTDITVAETETVLIKSASADISTTLTLTTEKPETVLVKTDTSENSTTKIPSTEIIETVGEKTASSEVNTAQIPTTEITEIVLTISATSVKSTAQTPTTEIAETVPSKNATPEISTTQTPTTEIQ